MKAPKTRTLSAAACGAASDAPTAITPPARARRGQAGLAAELAKREGTA
jgi:hypothetical protein